MTLSKNLISIEYLSVDKNNPLKVNIDAKFYRDKRRKETGKKSPKKKRDSRIEQLQREIRQLEKKEITSDIRDKIIRKRRELCELVGVETDVSTNIYTHNYNPRKGQSFTKF